MIIYKAQNKINGKIYIGQTINNLNIRIACHLTKESLFSKALRKYGIQSFEFSVIDSTLLKEIANEKEKYWIKHLNCKHPNGYNLTIGGQGTLGHKHSEQSKRKMSLAGKGRKKSEKWKKEKSKERRGKKLSLETRRKISEARIGKKHPRKGHPLSEETRQKISISRKGQMLTEEHRKKLIERSYMRGKTHSPEAREKIRIANKGKILSPETRKKISDARKRFLLQKT